MAIEPERSNVTDHAPQMFSRPTEPPENLSPLRSGPLISQLHAAWSRFARAEGAGIGVRARRSTRFSIDRIRGRADHELIGDLIRAVDELAGRCDELANRVASQQVLTGEVVQSLGQEVARLSAAMANVTVELQSQAQHPTVSE